MSKWLNYDNFWLYLHGRNQFIRIIGMWKNHRRGNSSVLHGQDLHMQLQDVNPCEHFLHCDELLRRKISDLIYFFLFISNQCLEWIEKWWEGILT